MNTLNVNNCYHLNTKLFSMFDYLLYYTFLLQNEKYLNVNSTKPEHDKNIVPERHFTFLSAYKY